jgi:hypothetical protein
VRDARGPIAALLGASEEAALVRVVVVKPASKLAQAARADDARAHAERAAVPIGSEEKRECSIAD